MLDSDLPPCKPLENGRILFRKPPPDGFVSLNYEPEDNSRLVWKPKFKFECKFRLFQDQRGPCGRVLRKDFVCQLDNTKISFTVCNNCDPNVKEQTIRDSQNKKELPLIEEQVSGLEQDILGTESISELGLRTTITVSKLQSSSSTVDSKDDP